MEELIAKEIFDPTGTLKVIILRRKDGRYTYRRQQKSGLDWSKPTIDAGVYDSVDTAESEARQRVSWMKDLFN